MKGRKRITGLFLTKIESHSDVNTSINFCLVDFFFFLQVFEAFVKLKALR